MEGVETKQLVILAIVILILLGVSVTKKNQVRYLIRIRPNLKLNQMKSNN